MKLIGTLTSPYARKVRVVLAEKKIEHDFEIEALGTPESTIAAINPLGKIPALVLDDETVLFDSRVIVEYIDNAAPNNKLLPAPNRERTEVKRWEAVADGILDAAVLIVVENRRPAKQRSAEWISRQQEKITRGLDFMAKQIGENAWCMGMHFSLADIAVGCALGYLTLRFPEIDWREQHPALARLHEKLMQRPAFADTLPSN